MSDTQAVDLKENARADAFICGRMSLEGMLCWVEGVELQVVLLL
jgi:hypothetical protein